MSKTLELVVQRVALKQHYTIGRLYVDGEKFCDTLEDMVRDLNRNGKFDNGEKKVYGETAIPYGSYEVKMTYSPKFSKKATYKMFIHDGLMPEICDVPEFTGIRIHGGNTSKDTLGCILVGKNTEVGCLYYSLSTFESLYKILYQRIVVEGCKCYITVK